MKLYVIRHGQTTGDVEDRFGGAYDDGLTPEGFAQAEAMAKELAERGIRRIVCSDLIRAKQTASVLQAHTGASLVEDARVRERNQYGRFSGMRKAEHGDVAAAAKDRFFTAEEGETYEEFAVRLAEGFTDIAKADETTAIVWHGGGMRVLFREILKLGELSFIGDCSWVELTLVNGQFCITGSAHVGFEFSL
jgi:glucosyl-3-phosphoglycerate phosphatase